MKLSHLLKKKLYISIILTIFIFSFIPPIAVTFDLLPILSPSKQDEIIIYKDVGNIKFIKSTINDMKNLNIIQNDIIFLKSELVDFNDRSITSNKEDSLIIFSRSEKTDRLIPLIKRIDDIVVSDFKVTIFMYHRFVDIPRNPYEISVTQFEEEMRYLYENGYKTITLGQYIDAVYSKDVSSLPEKPVVLTVDDGYKSFLTRAYPILKKYGFTATLFIYTNFIGNGGSSLSWNELRELVKEGIEIGSHSKSHSNIASPKRMKYSVSYDTFLDLELGQSKEILERNLGVNIRLFAWPYGSYNQTAVKKAVEHGYEGILTVKPGSINLDSDLLYIRRYGVYPSTKLELFALRLKMPVDKVVFSTEEIAEMKMIEEGEYIMKTSSSYIADEKAINESYNAIFEALDELNKLKGE
ncbi:MAG: polysaccharide deacetylase family protein [bacterium]